jgi:glycosidase
LHRHGLKLLLDFIPNHVGLDHPWLHEEPQLFVHNSKKMPGMFEPPGKARDLFIAHGKDPYFPPWTDTAQLDYRNPETRTRMQNELLSVANRCDGVRCDMAMLLLEEVFARNWAGVPAPVAPMDQEFWVTAIGAIRSAHPDFVFVAEAYWDLECRLQQLGFDYTYLKAFYDHVMARRFPELHALLKQPREFLARGAYFLENHDEERVAGRLGWSEHKAAAVLLMSMPGLRLLHDGQLEGLSQRVPVQIGVRPPENPSADVARFYDDLLVALQDTSIGAGEWSMLEPVPADEKATLPAGLFTLQWQSEPRSFDLVVVNLSSETIHCRITPAGSGIAEKSWIWRSIFNTTPGLNLNPELKEGELRLIVPPQHAEVLRAQASP